MRRRYLALPLLCALGCSDDADPAAPGDHPPPADVRVVRDAVTGVPSFGAVPYPSDLYLDPDGHVAELAGLERLLSKHPEHLAKALHGTRGFARQAGAVFYLDGELDPASLPSGVTDDPSSGVALVDVDPDSPRRGQSYAVQARWLPSLGCVSLTTLPGVVLPPGVRHAAVLTRALRDAAGAAIGASDELARIAGLSAAARATPAEALDGAALDALAEVTHLRRSEVAGLATFTTSNDWAELHELRAQVRATQPVPSAVFSDAAAAPYRVALFSASTTPSLDDWLGTPARDSTGREWPGGDDPAGVAHDAIGLVASFALRAPTFLDPTTKHIERATDGAFHLVDPAALVPVTLVVPSAPPPVGGYPVVVHGHGLSNDRGSMLSYANELARAGFVIVGIDDVAHGTRAGLADQLNRFPGTYEGPDGIPDSLPFAVSFLGGLSDFLAMRDNFRQTIVDQCSLVRWLQSPGLDLSPLSGALGRTPTLDGAHLAWSGGSLGGIVGSLMISVEPELRAAALQVPGAGFLPYIAGDSAELATVVSGVATATLGITGSEVLDELHPAALLLASTTEAGDPISQVGAVFGAAPPGFERAQRPHVLVTYSVDDEVLPNVATHALLRALGLPIAGDTLVSPERIDLVAAPLSGNLQGVTAAAVQYAPSTHALGYNRWDKRQFLPGTPATPPDRFPQLAHEIRIELPIREHSDQLTAFLTGALSGVPTITLTAPPRADFDADGVLDDAERAQGTDPYDPESH